jgi:hypothetical protein
MMKFVINLKKIFEKNKSFLRLISVKKKDNSISCEFSELLQIDGKLIKFSIEDIAKNKNIQKNILPEVLFILGTIHGENTNSLNEFRVRKTDLLNKLVTLENRNQLITIKINDLIHDENLIKQINSLDLAKLICPYMYKLGYDMHKLISEKSSSAMTETDQKSSEVPSNIIKLF